MPKKSLRSLAERYEHGRSLRKKAPLEKHADLLGPVDRNPVAILAAGDRTRVPELVSIRYERMLASPFTFLRGAAAVIAEDLASNYRRDSRAGLRRLPPTEFWRIRNRRGKHPLRHQ
jgi:hypothetical protein